MKIDDIILKNKKLNTPFERLINIKTYLSTIDKFKFLNEYKNIINKHKDDYPDYLEYVSLVFFNLLVVKRYTDIEFDMDYDDFDKLQQNRIIGFVVEKIGEDYDLLLNLVKINK